MKQFVELSLKERKLRRGKKRKKCTPLRQKKVVKFKVEGRKGKNAGGKREK